MGLKIVSSSRNPDEGRPAYLKIQQKVLEDLEKGLWAPGTLIPTEKSLAEQHQVSIGTVKKAILNLVNEGWLYRVQGKGTYVAGTTLRRENLKYYRLLDSFKDDEAKLKIGFLGLKAITGRPEINEALNIGPKSRLFELRRYLETSERKTVYVVSYLPKTLFPGLDEFPVSKFEKTTLFNLVEQHYGMPTIFNQELIGVAPAVGEAAKVLEVPEGETLLHVEMLAYTYKEQPYEYRYSFCRTDQKKIFREF
jgi:DNA-binding GntR family transcriptional regulator